ncbi:hypothetical protein [Rufibacter immobilis]|uniref:hypothetical protein n=1 Tax=Rufibacter immobilis TaxID=1348778 RepID=UPI0035EFB01A
MQNKNDNQFQATAANPFVFKLGSDNWDNINCFDVRWLLEAFNDQGLVYSVSALDSLMFELLEHFNQDRVMDEDLKHMFMLVKGLRDALMKGAGMTELRVNKVQREYEDSETLPAAIAKYAPHHQLVSTKLKNKAA